jgi:hypothetical protein
MQYSHITRIRVLSIDPVKTSIILTVIMNISVKKKKINILHLNIFFFGFIKKKNGGKVVIITSAMK